MSPRKGKNSKGKKVIVKTEPVQFEYTFETKEDILFFRDVNNAFKARKEFEEKNPNKPCQIGTYLTRKQAEDDYRKYRSDLAKVSQKMLKKPPPEVIILDDDSGSNGDDDDETVYSAEIMEDPNHKKSTEMDKKPPAKVTPPAKIDRTQLDNHHGVFYVLFTQKELFYFPSLVELHEAFDKIKMGNKGITAHMTIATDEQDIQGKYKLFLQDPTAFVLNKTFPKANLHAEFNAAAKWSDTTFVNDNNLSRDHKMPPPVRIINPYTAGRTSSMTAVRAAVPPSEAAESCQFKAAWLVNGSFKIDPMLISITKNRINLNVHVCYPGEEGALNGGVGMRKFLILLDLLNSIFQNGEKPASFWLFKPSLFEHFESFPDMPEVKGKELLKAKKLLKRAQPFGENRALVHANQEKLEGTTPHQFLAVWMEKKEGVTIEQQVNEFLANIAEDIMTLAFQQQFHKMVSFVHPNKLHLSYKSMDKMKNHEITQSLWVHFLAGLKKPNIMHCNRLRKLLVDEQIHRYLPDFIFENPDRTCHLDVNEFAFGESDEEFLDFFGEEV